MTIIMKHFQKIVKKHLSLKSVSLATNLTPRSRVFIDIEFSGREVLDDYIHMQTIEKF